MPAVAFNTPISVDLQVLQESNPPMLRRHFLKSMLAFAGLVLAPGLSCSTREGRQWQELDMEPSVDILTPLVIAYLSGVLPKETKAQGRILCVLSGRMRQLLNGLSDRERENMNRLLWLLDFPLSRVLLTRSFRGLERRPIRELEELLDTWRRSDLIALRLAYQGLHELVMASWYGWEDAWSTMAYPGPPRIGE